MSKDKTSIGDRMKRYESVPRIFLTRRVPVVIRLDGKAFHTFTRGLRKPFDNIMVKSMQDTMRELCENIQGCVFGYTQSDEITLVLTDYKTITTDAWFGYNVQKICSVAASMATLFFNRAFNANAPEMLITLSEEEDMKYISALHKAVEKGAMFDARCFSVPEDEVCNCLVWRQQDAVRNSIEAVGQAYLSSNQLHGKNVDAIREMLLSEKGVNWNNLPIELKRGSCCYRVETKEEIQDPRDTGKSILISRRKWHIDHNPPLFTENRSYVERWVEHSSEI